MCSNDGLYRPCEIEKKWQRFWEESGIFKAQDCDDSRPKYYVLDMFPTRVARACTSDIQKVIPQATLSPDTNE